MTTMPRAPRCQVLAIGCRGANRCESEAVDPDGEILICQSHLARALELAGHLPGIQITLTAGATS